MINVFLGGTCANNNWREEFTAALIATGIPADTIFNPVLPPGVDWTQADADREHEAKATAKFNLFYIADPKQERNTFSAYSTCEAIMGLYDDPGAVVVVFDQTGMEGHALKAMKQIERDLIKRFPYGRIFNVRRAVQYLADALGCNDSFAAGR